MAHYIDADELLNKLPDDLPYKASVKRVLMQAEAVEIVCCKDCKYKFATAEAGYDPHDIVCAYHASDGFDETDFCSAAVRGRYGEGNDG